VKCEQALECITDAAGGILSAELLLQFQEHITQCTQCRIEYDLECATKNVVRHRLHRANPPAALRESISHALLKELETPPVTTSVLRKSITWLSRRTTLAISFGLALILLFYFFTSNPHHRHTQPNDGNMIHLTFNDYDSVLDGKFVPAVASSDPSTIATYLQPAVNFPVAFPPMRRCSLIGGKCTHYCTSHLAHLFYHLGNNVVYLVQTRYSELSHGNELMLPDSVRQQLDRTGWYFETHGSDCNLVIWLKDSLICCAVADIPREQLFASLTQDH